MPQYLTLFTVVLSFSDNIPNATISYPVHCRAFFLWQYSKCLQYLTLFTVCIILCRTICLKYLTLFTVCADLFWQYSKMLQYLTLFTVCTILCRTKFKHAYNFFPCSLSVLTFFDNIPTCHCLQYLTLFTVCADLFWQFSKMLQYLTLFTVCASSIGQYSNMLTIFMCGLSKT